jgi:hypothetical protein
VMGDFLVDKASEMNKSNCGECGTVELSFCELGPHPTFQNRLTTTAGINLVNIY